MTAVGSDDSDAVSKNDVLDGNIICHMILLQMNGSTLPRTSNRVSNHEVVSTDRTITQQGSPHRSLRNKKQQASKQASNLFNLVLSLGVSHMSVLLSPYEYV